MSDAVPPRTWTAAGDEKVAVEMRPFSLGRKMLDQLSFHGPLQLGRDGTVGIQLNLIAEGPAWRARVVSWRGCAGFLWCQVRHAQHPTTGGPTRVEMEGSFSFFPWWVFGGHPHHSSAGFGAASQGVAKKEELAVALRLHPTLSPRLFLEESQQTVSCGLCGWPISIMTEIRLCHNCSLSQSGGAMMTSCSTSQTVQTHWCLHRQPGLRCFISPEKESQVDRKILIPPA